MYQDNPAPREIKAAREATGLTQAEAAGVVHSAMRSWQDWEAGRRNMPPGLWELFQLKTAGQGPTAPAG